MIEWLKTFYLRVFSRCVFCDKLMLWAPGRIYITSQSGCNCYPSCYQCMCDYVKMTAEMNKAKEEE